MALADDRIPKVLSNLDLLSETAALRNELNGEMEAARVTPSALKSPDTNSIKSSSPTMTMDSADSSLSPLRQNKALQITNLSGLEKRQNAPRLVPRSDSHENLTNFNVTSFGPYVSVSPPSRHQTLPMFISHLSVTSAAIVPPRSPPPMQPLSTNRNGPSTGPLQSTQQLLRENLELKKQLEAKNDTIEAMKAQIKTLRDRVDDLKQLPTGKISQIPVSDMMDLMQVYGSELSDTSLPPRKTCIQKASIVRQFRRWNPNFFEYFEHRDGKWVPKLGTEGELRRREELRRRNNKRRKRN